MRQSVRLLLIAALCGLAPLRAVLADEPQTSEHGFFPLLGERVRERGYDLGDPYGVMPYFYYQSSKILISDLKLGVNNGPLFDASFIKMGQADATANAFGIRPNLMVLPFLSVYMVYTTGSTETKVPIQEPFQFVSTANSTANVFGLGATLQYGYKGFFGVADFNGTVADVHRLADLVGGNMLSFRLGYAKDLGPNGRRLAVWLGTAGQVIETDTSGSVRLADVLGPPEQSAVDSLYARCNAFGPNDPRKGPCTSLADKMQAWVNGTEPNASVQYSLTKKPVDIWNMVAGAQYSLNRAWHFRAEGTFVGGRSSVLLATEYRFDFH